MSNTYLTNRGIIGYNGATKLDKLVSKGTPLMTQQERDNRDAQEAVTQLAEVCWNKTAEQLAELEAQFAVLGLSKLANIVFGYGIGNAGDDYLDLRHNAL